MSNNSTGGLGEVIFSEVTTAIGDCLLTLASYIDVTATYEVSESSLFLSRIIFVDTVKTCDALNNVFLKKWKVLD